MTLTPRMTMAVALVVEHLRWGDDAEAAVYEAAEFWTMTRAQVREAFREVHGVSPENWRGAA